MNIPDAASIARDWGFLTQNEVSLLQDMANRCPARPSVINVGAGAGTSALALLQARPDLRLYTVDIAAKGYGSLELELQTLQMAGVNLQHYHPVLGDSREVGRSWPGPSADLIFIDDGHLLPEALGDIQVWAPHVLPGGWMLLHDYGSAFWPDVAEAVRQTLETWPNWKRGELIDHLLVYEKEF